MYAPHTVTIYNQRITTDENLEDVVANEITILHGVFLTAQHGAAANNPQYTGKDKAILYIPRDAEAVDGITGLTKRLALSLPQNGTACFFIRGEVVAETATFAEINAAYPDVYTVVEIKTNDYGSGSMQHIKVVGQ